LQAKSVSPAPRGQRVLAAVTLFWAGALVISSVSPFDRATWLMEVLPVLIAWPVLFAARGAFPLTSQIAQPGARA
jgi:putative membrane protein